MNRATSPTGWARNPDGSPGYTWNPITGCLNHTNGLCKGGGFPCYAYRLANGRLKTRYLNGGHLAPKYKDAPLNICIEDGKDPFYPRFWRDRLDQLRKKTQDTTKRKGVFVCDMGDLFGIGVPESWTRAVLNRLNDTNNMRHRFYLLTKQPQNLIKFSPFPDNCWVGITATSGKMVDDAGYYLEKIEAKVKFLSVEPLLEPMLLFFGKPTLDWLIIGACTGTYGEMLMLHSRLHGATPTNQLMPFGNKYTLQPRIEWVREIVDAADKAGVKVFLKDNLKPLKLKYPMEYKWAFTEDRGAYFFRQEMPEIK